MPRCRVFRAAADLSRPAPLTATAILAVNDHVLKGSGVLPGAVTGKLSDLAGLFVAPIVLVCIARIVASARDTERRVEVPRDAVLAIVVVAAGFALLKTWSPFNAAVNSVWGPHVLDPSDLWCLPSVLLAWVWLRDRARLSKQTDSTRTRARATRPDGEPRFGSALVFAGTLLVCAATPKAPPVPPPPVPMWSIAAKPLELGCGTAAVWVSKSGKTGIGVTVRVTPKRDHVCIATVSARLRFAERAFAGTLVVTKSASELLDRDDDHGRARDERRELAEHANAAYHYLAFELDNQARWNRGDRTATFELAIDAGAESAPTPGSATPSSSIPVATGSTTGSVAARSATPGATGSSTTPVATGSAAPTAPGSTTLAPASTTPGANTTRLTWSLAATHAYAEFPVNTR